MSTRRDLVEDIYPLSPLQEGLLFHALYAPDLRLYFQQLRCTFQGELDREALREAWRLVVERHQPLRTAFLWERRDRPLQIVHRRVDLPWEELDLSGLPEDERRALCESFLAADYGRGFELSKAPLLRLTLIRLGDVSRFVWSYHHLILDGWSVSLVLEEVLAAYAALRQGRALQLEPARPFSQYIAWLQKQDPARAESFWRSELAGVTGPTRLGIDQGDGARDAGQGEWRASIPEEGTAALQELARRNQLTLNTLLQGAWALVLDRYAGSGDVVFGSTVSGRPPVLEGVERMVGLLINTLPVRVRVPRGARLLPWLRTLQEQQLELRQFEHTPLAEVQRWSEVPGGVPLFETLLVFESFPAGPQPESGGEGLGILGIDSVESTHYPITLLAQGGPVLGLRLFYQRGRFEPAAAARLLEHLKTLLLRFPGNMERGLQDLAPWTDVELQQVLREWNDVETLPVPRATLYELFARRVAQAPGAVALELAGEGITYAELRTRAERLAGRLRALKVGPEVRVGLLTDRSPAMVVGVLGILAAGGAYVPLDPSHPAERLAWILEDSRVSVLVVEAGLASSAPAVAADLVVLDREGIPSHPDPASVPEAQPAAPDPASLAYVIYTSGSTGRPKGVQVTHAGVVNFLRSMERQVRMTERDVLVAVTTLSFDISVLELLLPLTVGGCVALATREVATDGARLARRLAASGATVLQATPATWRLLLESGWEGSPGLTALCGGEALSRDLADRLLARCAALWNVYGPTETTIWSAIHQVEPGAGPVPLGRPLANTTLHVLDGELRPVPIGCPGELHIGGMGLARGYWGRPELTAERFPPDPFAGGPGERLYRTGDLVRRRSDGHLEFLGRLDHQVKIRGFRIELGEIEAVLRRHPGVREVVVLADGGPADARLVAYVVPASREDPPAADSLREHLERALPSPMVPAVFLSLPELPLTPNGKIDRRALPRPGEEAMRRSRALVPPRDALELRLVRIWEELLQTRPLGVTDSFFQVGGHSLLAVRLVSRVLKQFGREVPLSAFVPAPTVERLAALLRAGQETVVSPRVEIRGGSGTPLNCVHAAGGHVLCYCALAARLPSAWPVYGLQAPGLESDEEPLASVEAMADRYLGTLREAQPRGPYLLLGWSFGGLVAYEMARRLAATGEEVPLLALLDTAVPVLSEVPDDTEFLVRWSRGNGLELDRDELERQGDFEARLACVVARLKQAGRIPPDVQTEQARRYFRVSKAARHAAQGYRPGAYPGRLVLFRVSDPPDSPASDPTRGWAALAAGGVEVVDIPGEHDTLVEEPHVETLARRLAAFLDTVPPTLSDNAVPSFARRQE